jgi:hypothetical protein
MHTFTAFPLNNIIYGLLPVARSGEIIHDLVFISPGNKFFQDEPAAIVQRNPFRQGAISLYSHFRKGCDISSYDVPSGEEPGPFYCEVADHREYYELFSIRALGDSKLFPLAFISSWWISRSSVTPALTDLLFHLKWWWRKSRCRQIS